MHGTGVTTKIYYFIFVALMANCLGHSTMFSSPLQNLEQRNMQYKYCYIDMESYMTYKFVKIY
jgi:hypothetical protein